MASVLKFDGGAVDVDFVTDAAYHLTAWAPAVATRRMGDLAGRGPFNDVDETMTISITGASALAKLEALMEVMDEAARWARGEPQAAVLLKYKPTASSEEMHAVVMGPPSSGGPMVTLPPNFPLSAATQAIDPVTVRFRRSALWLGGVTTVTATTTNNPQVKTHAGFAYPEIASPVKLQVTGIEGNGLALDSSYVLMVSGTTAADAAQRLVVFDAADMADAGEWTEETDLTYKSNGNTVLRLTPVSLLGERESPQLSVSPGTLTATLSRRWGIFVNYRNNSATASWRVSAGFYGTDRAYGETMPVVIEAGVSDPLWLYLGSLAIPGSLSKVTLIVDGSVLGEDIDFDDIVLMAMDYPDSDRAIALLETNSSVAISTTRDLVIDHQLLTKQEPSITLGSNNFRPYQGNATLYMREFVDAVAVAWLGTGYLSSGFWRVTDASNNIQTPGYSVTATTAYLTPK